MPAVRIVDAPVGSVIASLELSPMVDADGAVVDHLVTESIGSGTTLLFGEVTALRWRRLSELEHGRSVLMNEMLSRLDGADTITVELRVAERRMLVHLSRRPDRVVTLTFARVDGADASGVGDAKDERIRRLRTLMAHLSDGIAMYDPVRDEHARIVDFVCLEMSDADPVLPAEEQVGQRLLDLFPESLTNGTFAHYARVIDEGETWTPEPLLYERAGQRYAYRVAAHAVDGRLVVSWRDTLVDGEPNGLAATDESLTPRQLDILEAIASGSSTSDIAASLFLSPFTVRNEVRRILAKLGVRTRAEAAALAVAQNLITGLSTTT